MAAPRCINVLCALFFSDSAAKSSNFGGFAAFYLCQNIV
jgi:hypothetical protein